MKVLVTGASGFIGSNLVKKLISLDYQVTALVRKKNRKLSDSKNLKIVIGDLTDLSSLKQAMKGVEVVFNCAAVLPHHKLDEHSYMQVNTNGVANILSIARKRKIKRFIQVSTVGIYGPSNQRIISEKSPVKLSDAYSRSKKAAEDLIRLAIREYKIPTVIIRPTIAYGPGDVRPGFSNLFGLVRRHRFVPVGPGSNYFHTIYVENLVDGLILAMTKKSAIGQDFIIGDDSCPTMKEIISTIAQVERVSLPGFYLPLIIARAIGLGCDLLERVGLKGPLNTRRVNFITENRRYSIRKAQQLLGYKPKFNLTEGITRTEQWYVSKGL